MFFIKEFLDSVAFRDFFWFVSIAGFRAIWSASVCTSMHMCACVWAFRVCVCVCACACVCLQVKKMLFFAWVSEARGFSCFCRFVAIVGFRMV